MLFMMQRKQGSENRDQSALFEKQEQKIGVRVHLATRQSLA